MNMTVVNISADTYNPFVPGKTWKLFETYNWNEQIIFFSTQDVSFLKSSELLKVISVFLGIDRVMNILDIFFR